MQTTTHRRARLHREGHDRVQPDRDAFRRYRERAGLTQVELARRIAEVVPDVKPSVLNVQLSNLEHGRTLSIREDVFHAAVELMGVAIAERHGWEVADDWDEADQLTAKVLITSAHVATQQALYDEARAAIARHVTALSALRMVESDLAEQVEAGSAELDELRRELAEAEATGG